MTLMKNEKCNAVINYKPSKYPLVFNSLSVNSDSFKRVLARLVVRKKRFLSPICLHGLDLLNKKITFISFPLFLGD